MEKNKRWPVLGPVTFLLVVIMLFADFFGRDIVPFDRWMQQFSRSQVDEEKPPQSPFARLVGGKRSSLPFDGRGRSEKARKPLDLLAMLLKTRSFVYQISEISTFSIISHQSGWHGANQPPVCQYNHEVPAVIFSSGISGNIFHEFNDILIPLFITTKHFQSRVLIILED
ncbi:Xylan glycosyltransferase MUCI21 [Sesamum angolense]|uniref:Xylan glycosyltransferase MUCI21 n=1 Tax=Sesamum angolense TaxID=2727404 RepID=A0AAE1WSG5_9LAMI|nr:Xylan glycosyltransferase MUCI21 [Sesamum angolense]